MSTKSIELLEYSRTIIAEQVRDLRTRRRWTQKELATKIGLSQARLSELERGAGSFTAEQLLLMLHLFNVPVTHFAPGRPADEHAELQNALARLGASHLQESEHVLPSERFAGVASVVRESLVIGSSRLVTALAPVLVSNIDQLSLPRLDSELRALGLDRRLPWLAENVLAGIRKQRTRPLPRELDQRYRRAETVLEQFLDVAHRRPDLDSGRDERPADLLDRTIRSKRTLAEVTASRSEISQRWGVVSGLQPTDFVRALEAARAGTR